MIRTIIIDDHPIVRAGIRTILEATEDIRVVAEGSTANEALSLVEQHHPHVLILDIHLPDGDGLQVTRRLIEQGATCKILVLTALDDDKTIFGLLESGAIGYVLKDEALEHLVGAVRAAAEGRSWLSPAVATQLVGRLAKEEVTPTSKDTYPQRKKKSPEALTEREKEVLALLAQGLDNQEIAQKLVITTRTVQNHVSNIYAKLGTSSRTQATLTAFRMGIAHPPIADDES